MTLGFMTVYDYNNYIYLTLRSLLIEIHNCFVLQVIYSLFIFLL